MRGAGARKHYRVAQREVEHSPERGTFIGKHNKHKFLIISFLFLILVFIKGFLIGYFLKKNTD